MPGFLFKQECISIEGAATLQIRSLLDKQQFADPLGEAEALGISSAAWPLFGMLWPSGLHLAEAMAKRPLINGESILEIGCGLGLASLVSHRRGSLVTASDCHPLAASFMLENLRLNDLPPLRYCHGNWAALIPGQTPSLRVPLVQGRFDLIMGSDVLYERDDAGMLAEFISTHAMPASEVMIVDPNRGNRAAFSKRMAALGYALDDRSIKLSATADSPAYSGRLLHYRRSHIGIRHRC
ncbi:class I SAM-dependent methyltransferase [Roseateles oligotrophus]|uniref:SAM-dependent methyltransferase n=1 Tax=Roseateles oligotrophus TaxID=1769250 RepID=A0ABT2YM39_9BURK|nr:SAM-dependent methyltransferase [Roseateles oligotrophus]MCV2371135.1 SAM-dependent methyltransferase [Roseateles oligotrophus]